MQAAAARLAKFRKVRDQIEAHIRRWLGEHHYRPAQESRSAEAGPAK